MHFKIIQSPNYSKKTRKLNKIKFLVIHYTGMQSVRASINRLTNPRYKVSCHYLIDRKGKILEIYDMVPLSKNSVCSKKASKYALEVNSGWFAKNNINIGDEIKVKKVLSYDK